MDLPQTALTPTGHLRTRGTRHPSAPTLQRTWKPGHTPTPGWAADTDNPPGHQARSRALPLGARSQVNSAIARYCGGMTGSDLPALRKLADAGNEEAADRLAVLAAERGDFDELKQLVDTGNDLAAERLAELAAKRGDLETLTFLIDAGSEAGADRLAEIVAARGDLEELSRLADEGSDVAATLLTRVIGEAN